MSLAKFPVHVWVNFRKSKKAAAEPTVLQTAQRVYPHGKQHHEFGGVL